MELQLRLGAEYFQKDPQSSDLGRRIVAKSIEMIDFMGFEDFTFKKLSMEINSTEASIYRYFENKHRLLLYLIAWYWSWLEYQIEVETKNLTSAEDQLRSAITILTRKKHLDTNFPDINEESLQRIAIAEADKTYLVKNVDAINKVGLFKGYKRLSAVIADMIRKVNPNYPFPRALATTILEASHQQLFFAAHLPALSELTSAPDRYSENYHFLEHLAFSVLKRTVS